MNKMISVASFALLSNLAMAQAVPPQEILKSGQSMICQASCVDPDTKWQTDLHIVRNADGSTAIDNVYDQADTMVSRQSSMKGSSQEISDAMNFNFGEDQLTGQLALNQNGTGHLDVAITNNYPGIPEEDMSCELSECK